MPHSRWSDSGHRRGGTPLAPRRWFLFGCWLPPTLWAATLLYLRPYDGWGAWAAAPLLLPSLALAAVWLAVGVGLVLRAAAQTGRADIPLLTASVIGGAAVIYYTVAYWVRTAG